MKFRKWNIAFTACAVLAILICAFFLVPTEHSARVESKVRISPDQAQQRVATPLIASAQPSPGASSPALVANARREPLSSAASVTPSAPPAAKLILEDAGLDRSFTVAMNELVRKLPSGAEQSVALPPQADMAGLRERLNDLQHQGGGEIFPVAYEDGVDRSLQTRRLVTPTIRVKLKEGQDLAQGIPGAVEVKRPDYAPGFVVVKMRDSFAAMDALASVRALGGVQKADVLLAKQQSLRALPNDPLITSQWHLKNTGQGGGVAGTDINVESVWNYPGSGYRGAGIVVGVVDNGLETTHPDLAANVRTDIDHDWNDGTPNDPNPNPGDDNNHGTSCAGNIAAIANNSLGVSGSAPEAQIVGLRLTAASEGDQEEAEAEAWRNDVIQIKSNSWGPNDDGITLEGPGSLTLAAFNTAVIFGRGGLGTIFLWAGGNGRDVFDNSNYDGYANSIYTIAISAITSKRQQTWYSEPGANLVVAAPSNGDTAIGELDITTVDRSGADGYNMASGPAGDYATDFGGTSSATPTAAGVVALMLQRNPNLGWRDVQEILIKTAVEVNPSDSDWTTNAFGYHFNHKFGAGLIDAAAAVAEAASWTNLSAQTSAVSTQSGLSIAIPDNNPTGITRTFDLGASDIRVEQVTVRLTINHDDRGDLAITLTSPSGVQSRLSEVHNDFASDYSDWTFMTTHDWGEHSTGTWTLKIADNVSIGTGTLKAAEITVFGTAAAPGNPPPVVQLTSPQTQAVFGAGTTITLMASAFDHIADGSAGVVTRVDFYANGALIGSSTAAPYTLDWKPPAAGSFTLSARAVDSEGATGFSATVSVEVETSLPVILISKKAVGSGGKMVLIRGRVSGVGLMDLKVKNRKISRRLAVAANAPFALRVRLHQGRNVIVLKAGDSQGNVSKPKRVVVSRP